MAINPAGEIFLYLALLFGATYLAAGLPARVRMPLVLGVLFVAMAAPRSRASSWASF